MGGSGKGGARPAKPVLEPNMGESQFARALGSSDFHTREAGLHALTTWLARKADISELDLLKLWKGVFYCFWHSDKAAVQVCGGVRCAQLPYLQLQHCVAVHAWCNRPTSARQQRDYPLSLPCRPLWRSGWAS